MAGQLELLFAKPVMIFNNLLNEQDYNFANSWLKQHFEKNAVEPKESTDGGPLYPEKGHGMNKTTVTVSTHAWDPNLQDNPQFEIFNKAILASKVFFFSKELLIKVPFILVSKLSIFWDVSLSFSPGCLNKAIFKSSSSFN